MCYMPEIPMVTIGKEFITPLCGPVKELVSAAGIRNQAVKHKIHTTPLIRLW